MRRTQASALPPVPSCTSASRVERRSRQQALRLHRLLLRHVLRKLRLRQSVIQLCNLSLRLGHLDASRQCCPKSEAYTRPTLTST